MNKTALVCGSLAIDIIMQYEGRFGADGLVSTKEPDPKVDTDSALTWALIGWRSEEHTSELQSR